MRKLGENRDSLELLLDTVCSMFGAILLIAILVALMAQTTREDTSGQRAGAEIIQRKIATAAADLTETRRLIAQTGMPASATAAELAAEKRQLIATLAEARAEGERVQAQLQDHIKRQTVDHSGEWKQLMADQRDLASQQAELENEIKTQDQNTARLNSRAADIIRAIKAEKESRVVSLRFPREHRSGKHFVSIVCKFGKIYPLMDGDGKKNQTSVVWSEKGSAELAQPVEALGWTLPENKSALDDFLNKINQSEFYIVFFVYPDSLDTYHALRDAVTAAHLDFGLELQRTGSELLMGAEGITPPAL